MKIITILIVCRFLVVFWPQTGYLHPDEFFQGPDIIAGSYFNSKITPPHEFTSDKPIRCMLVPYSLNLIAFKLAQFFQRKPTAYTLLVAPKLIYTLVSFIVDYNLFRLCKNYSARGLWYLPVLVIFQSSFSCLGLMTRSISNSIETIIFSIFLAVLCKALRRRFRIVFVTPSRSIPVEQLVVPSKQFKSSALLGTLLALGLFNRPTFICFACVPLLFWFKEVVKMHSYEFKRIIRLAVAPLTLTFCISFTLLSAFDTYYYKGFHIFKDLTILLADGKLDLFYKKLKTHWVVTPYNFVTYNANVENLIQYGIHLPITHAFVNIPLLFNVLSISYYHKIFQIARECSFLRLIFGTHRMYSMMIFITLSSTVLLSFIPHQEFRFLLPLIIPLVYSFAFTTYVGKRNWTSWLLINFFLVYFYTCIHQSGVIRGALDLDPLLKKHEYKDNPRAIRVVALGCYPVPSYLWNIQHDDQRFELDVVEHTFVELGPSLDDEFESLSGRLGEIASVYILLPSVYKNELEDRVSRLSSNSSSTIAFKEIKHYGLNYNYEHFNVGWKYFWSSPSLSSFKRAFGFSVFEMNIKEKYHKRASHG